MERNMGHKLTGGIGHCDHCVRGKTQKKPISKGVDDRDLEEPSSRGWSGFCWRTQRSDEEAA